MRCLLRTAVSTAGAAKGLSDGILHALKKATRALPGRKNRKKAAKVANTDGKASPDVNKAAAEVGTAPAAAAASTSTCLLTSEVVQATSEERQYTELGMPMPTKAECEVRVSCSVVSSSAKSVSS